MADHYETLAVGWQAGRKPLIYGTTSASHKRSDDPVHLYTHRGHQTARHADQIRPWRLVSSHLRLITNVPKSSWPLRTSLVRKWCRPSSRKISPAETFDWPLLGPHAAGNQ